VPGSPVVVTASGLALLYRAAAWLSPSRAIAVPPSLAIPLGGLGLTFLLCAVWAWRRHPSTLTRTLLVYGFGGAIHWGGAVGAPSPRLEAFLLAAYVAATAFGDGAFLDLSLRYGRAPVVSRLRSRAPYALGALTLLATPIAPFLPEPALAAVLGAAILLAFLMSAAAGVLFLARWLQARPGERRETGLTAIVAALIVATLLDLAAEAGRLPGEPDAWKLLYGLVPLALAHGLSRAPDRAPGGA